MRLRRCASTGNRPYTRSRFCEQLFGCHMPADPQVLLHGQLGEDPPALQHLLDAQRHDLGRRLVVDRLAVENH